MTDVTTTDDEPSTDESVLDEAAAMLETFRPVPRIEDPTDEQREYARHQWPDELVPDEGPVPEPFYTLHRPALFAVPDWVVEAIAHRLHRQGKEGTPEQTRDLVHEYVDVRHHFETADGEKFLDAAVNDRVTELRAEDEPELSADGGTDIDVGRELRMKGSVPVHVDVELPAEVWAEEDYLEGDRLTAALLDYLAFEYRFTVDGEEVHRTPGYGPDESAETQGSDTQVHAHTGERLEPVDVEDLPEAVRERVEAHVAWTDAYDVEVRHHGGATVDIVHRFSPDA